MRAPAGFLTERSARHIISRSRVPAFLQIKSSDDLQKIGLCFNCERRSNSVCAGFYNLDNRIFLSQHFRLDEGP